MGQPRTTFLLDQGINRQVGNTAKLPQQLKLCSFSTPTDGSESDPIISGISSLFENGMLPHDNCVLATVIMSVFFFSTVKS